MPTFETFSLMHAVDLSPDTGQGNGPTLSKEERRILAAGSDTETVAREIAALPEDERKKKIEFYRAKAANNREDRLFYRSLRALLRAMFEIDAPMAEEDADLTEAG